MFWDMFGREPRARYAALSGFVEVCRPAGVDPLATMRAHGLDPGLLDQPDSWAGADAIMATLESAARTAGCPTLGLRMSRVRSLSSLGPVSLALAAESTLEGALDLLSRFWPSYNESLRLELRDEGVWTRAIIRFHVAPQTPLHQASDLAAGVLRSLAASRSGTRPPDLGLRLRHEAPDDVSEYEQLFGAGVEFSADEDAVLVRTQDLHAVQTDEDPQRRAYARRYLESVAPAAAESRTEQVRSLVTVLLPTGRCSASRVAASLGVDRRTVNRWLEHEGWSFTSVVRDVRRQQAERSLRAGGRLLTEVAEELGFATLSSFSGWFAQEYGCSPSRWREGLS